MKTIPVTKESLAKVIADTLKTATIGGDFATTTANTAGLIDKIGLQKTFSFPVKNELSWIDGESLSLGRTIEEFMLDFPMPMKDTSDTGSDVIYDPTYRKPAYSTEMKKVNWRESRRHNDLQRAFNDMSAYSSAIADVAIRINEAAIDYKNQMKKELLGAFAIKAIGNVDGAKTYSATTAYKVGEYVKNADEVAIVFQEKTATSKTWANAIADGTLVKVELYSKLALPTDTASATNAIKEFKKYVLKGTRRNHENLNGSFMPSLDKSYLKLVLNEAVLPSIDVDALAGAFNPDKLGLGIDIESVETFGTEADSKGVWAMIVDQRGVKIHEDFEETLAYVNINHFTTWDKELQATPFYGTNTYIHAFVKDE